jgi:two-component system response regulator YesN
MMEQLQNLIFDEYGSRISFALSEEAIMLSSLRESYIALNRIVKLHFGMELLYSGGQVLENQDSKDEIIKLSSELKQNLYQGNEQKFLENCALLPQLLSDKHGSQNIPLIWHHMSAVMLEIYKCYSVPLSQKENMMFSTLITNTYLLQDAIELTRILEHCGKIIFSCQRQSLVNKSDQAISQINNYIENNLDSDLSLSVLASKVFLNPSYFSRLYKQVTGHNLSDFIYTKRMDRAKELLVNTNYKISDIASQIGFDSPSYFTVFFKKIRGISPAEYREQAQKYIVTQNKST